VWEGEADEAAGRARERGWLTGWLVYSRVFFSFSARVGQHGRAGHGRGADWLAG
jgi:hypothetical protein